ncbi:MAG: hydrogenase expression/formation protein HypE [Coriobacteriales bacterium]|jgi:hydrogenase expression/formation protein HypE|nr:hydrogenase expression/formation protein HypE [Coriobacteriales bacterium]
MRDYEQVVMAHGSGGALMRELIDGFFESYAADELKAGDDSATVCLTDPVTNLAFTTDSYVVTPYFFPGGDIGRLAVAGTVNDLSTSGATPVCLSVAFILEEGLPLTDLQTICESIALTADEARVKIVTGDTKVVPRGNGDGIYINTAGIGVFGNQLGNQRPLSGRDCQPGDKILLSGTLGDHGIAIIKAREGLSFTSSIISDVAPLNQMVARVLAAAPSTRCFRDPTRGGLASTINELATQSHTTMTIDEAAIPVQPAVQGAAEMLGFDIYQIANEGKMVAVVPPHEAEVALAAMQADPHGIKAAIIGEVGMGLSTGIPVAWVRTAFGATRVLDMLVGEQLPRIC